MSKEREALKLALDWYDSGHEDRDEFEAMMKVLLAEQPAQPVQCEPQQAVTDDGWCEWVCPKPQGYLMQCCDCGLIHEVESRVAKYEPRPSEVFEVVDDPDLQVQWRMKRRDDISPKQSSQQEPVGQLHEEAYGRGQVMWFTKPADQAMLYTAPQPSKPWVGLTRPERFEIEQAMSKYYDYRHECKTVCLPEFAAAIEAKLREKNAQPSKPLTDEQIEQCLKQAYATVQGRNLEHAFARAIEQAHGITGEKK